MNSNMPKDSGFDKTLSILKEGYEFVMNRDRDLDIRHKHFRNTYPR